MKYYFFVYCMVSSLHPPNFPDPNCSCGPLHKKLAAEHPLKPPYLVKKLFHPNYLNIGIFGSVMKLFM